MSAPGDPDSAPSCGRPPPPTDLLSRRSCDLLWLWSTGCAPSAGSRTAAQIRDSVFQNEEVRSLLSQSPDVRAHIERILEEMAHTWSLTGIRFVGYFVTKIMRRIYCGLCVDQEIRIAPSSPLFCARDGGVAVTIGRLVAEAPVLYLPTHRSYADFIVMSYVCFAMGLPLPSIAAGTDFLSLSQVSSLLRECGAFFIRRSSPRSDPVYWATFKAYVEEQIVGRERPIEFFPEGTRSRSGKSLPPKTGLLHIAVDLFLSGAVTDLIMLPICISYDRILEESLYAAEVSPGAAGTKPRETTAHLLAGARKILDQSYGSVYVRFCEPISVRQSSSNLHGIHIRRKADDNPSLVSSLVTEIAQSVTRKQVSGTILSAFDLFSFVVVAQHANQSSDQMSEQLAVSFTQVVHVMNELVQLIPAENLGRMKWWTLSDELVECIRVHDAKFVQVCADQLILKWDVISRNTMRIYANKSLQLLIDYSICSHVQTLEAFAVLKQLLAAEFCPSAAGELESSFAKSCQSVSLISCNLKSTLLSYVIFYLQSYQRMSMWLERICEEERLDLPLDFKSLTRRAAGDLSLASDLLTAFWLLVRQRVAAAGYKVTNKITIHKVLQQMKIEIEQQLANSDMVAGGTESLKSKL